MSLALKFTLLPWPDYFGKAPKARTDGMRHIAARPLKVAAAADLRELIRRPLDGDRHVVAPTSSTRRPRSGRGLRLSGPRLGSR